MHIINYTFKYAIFIAICLAIVPNTFASDLFLAPPLYVQHNNYNAGLLYKDGIEPGKTNHCTARFPNRCWWVDANAPDGGNGSFNNPYNSFEEVVGYRVKSDYIKGKLKGGDHLYITGIFDMNKHIENGVKSIQLYIGHSSQGGSAENPTIIKSYKNIKQAVFDGKFRVNITNMDNEHTGLITIQTFKRSPIKNVIIENIKVRNAVGLGINLGENTTNITVNSVTVHDTAIKKGAANSGGIKLTLKSNKPQITIKNSVFYRNYRNPNGVGFFSSGSNNIGGINILGDPATKPGAKVIISNNIILNEFYSIRHKKSGRITTTITNNYIKNAKTAFYVRSFGNHFNNNIVDNVKNTIVISAENQHGHIHVNIKNNTIVNAKHLLNTGYEKSDFKISASISKNIFSSQTSNYALAIYAGSPKGTYDLSNISSFKNVYHIKNNTLIKYERKILNGYKAFTEIDDKSSIYKNIVFLSPQKDRILNQYIIADEVTKKTLKLANIGALH